MNTVNIQKHLPLTESTAYILLALRRPLHGYGVMQEVEMLSENTVTVGAGTLYGAISTLEKQGLIIKVGEEGRRKLYSLTEYGKKVLVEHIRRTAILVEKGTLVKHSP